MIKPEDVPYEVSRACDRELVRTMSVPAAIAAALAEWERLGMVMMPVEPTPQMEAAFYDLVNNSPSEDVLAPGPIYRAMLAARGVKG